MTCGVGSRPLLRIILRGAKIEADVLACAPGFADARKHQDFRLPVGRHPVDDLFHFIVELGAHGIALIGAIQRDEGDAALALHQHVLVLLFGH
jgi:hypothetical protein